MLIIRNIIKHERIGLLFEQICVFPLIIVEIKKLLSEGILLKKMGSDS